MQTLKRKFFCFAALCLLPWGTLSCGSGGSGCPDGQVDWQGECLADVDKDGVPDAHDNCPSVPNPDQADLDSNKIGDACEELDDDGDGVINLDDNCPVIANPDQADWDEDGLGDACTYSDGTIDHPFIISVSGSRVLYEDIRDTTESISDIVDVYPPNALDESGPEYFYLFRLVQPMSISARIDFPEPDGVDIDLHLLASFDPLVLIERDHYNLMATLEPGVYYLVMDSFVEAGVEKSGTYHLNVEMNESHAGTRTDPIPLGDPPGQALSDHYVFTDVRDTGLAQSDELDSYPPNEVDESGPEFIYTFSLTQPSRVTADLLCPEPDGVDIDLHLLDSLDPLSLIVRGDKNIYAELSAGTYYLVADTFGGGGNALTGRYTLDVTVRPQEPDAQDTFNDYILAAVESLYNDYGLLGYDSAALTHDIAYGSHGFIEATAPPRTMCVAAALEVILTAMQLYEDDTGDNSIWDFLPRRSFASLGAGDLRGHVWVNHELNAGGTSDAVRHFGMGMTVPFEQLRPGSFINLNRTNGTGHAVIFLAFIDIAGVESDSWHADVVGFKYFSSQGGYDAGSGGFDYRYAVFDDFGEPTMPYRRDLHVIYSTNQVYLNTGMMYHPSKWFVTGQVLGLRSYSLDRESIYSVFDAEYFNGVTFDD
jgi:thrombospondin type 3 repeat protein